jgi:uncharacterized protein (DUF2126 family)/transglutaminase-like putative cysteine protease
MAIEIALHHRTCYRYDKEISLGPQLIQLRPALHARVPILSYSLEVTPSTHILNWQLDPYNNRLARTLFSGKTREFVVDVQLVADLTPLNPFDFVLEPGVEQYPFAYQPRLAADLRPYLETESDRGGVKAFLDLLAGQKSGTISLLLDLNRKIRDEIGYLTRLEPGVQTCEQTLTSRSGSCRDSAWLLVQCLRHLGIAARFVSGYLIQLETEDGPKEDRGDLHAWAEAFLPGAGWIGLDPTSGLLAAEGHIPLVCTPDAAQAAPISGTAEPSGVEFIHSLSVCRLNDVRRPSKPFTEVDWQGIRQLAHLIDRALTAQEVRLTMGGEPTYVGIDDPESRQWNIDAQGAMKRTRALALIEALGGAMAPGALLHFGQGKWYPGEPLPRWALSCYWRADGVAVWEDVQLIAREEENYGFSAKDALQFMKALTRRLEVSSDNILPAFNPATDQDTDRSQPAGYLLALRRRQPGGQLCWSSQLWFPRPERLVLSAGDSPIGYRVPALAIPWVAPDELEYEFEPAPFADRVRLPGPAGRRSELFEKEPEADPLPAVFGPSDTAEVLIRPSLGVEAREGRLHVFLPFTTILADYLDLLSAIEDTCRYLKVPVWVEGYAPPSDPRLKSLSVTPDPGVLEVNLPPAGNWDELENIYTVLDDKARGNRLTADKFQLNGEQITTGGGSHIVIGGATVADSPVLRRPDLLRSMVAFWQNHPSLSYLFSGMYVGPTSQHPRVDEARLDTLYELEVAFAQLPVADCAPWIVDGLFRNLLADITGNTHRAEFCVDKLFPPPGYGSRLGLLELRAFEMPPHVRMNLLQMLLVRGMVSMLWKTPFDGSLIRWGATLHDRFMLPEFLKHDLFQVLAELRRSGFDFKERWFAAHLEFRFPRIGALAAEGIELELRRALEPWNVLAEESISGSTVRSVDSSLERIQVKVSGLAQQGRYVVACNGRRVPLVATPQAGVAVAGVRYRARQLSAQLHPTVPVHAPLEFDLIDCLANRSIGRCRYHVTHPDGHHYTSRPASSAEAEGRRLERFEETGAAPPFMALPEEEANPIYPFTLDLRRLPPGPGSQAERLDLAP